MTLGGGSEGGGVHTGCRHERGSKRCLNHSPKGTLAAFCYDSPQAAATTGGFAGAAWSSPGSCKANGLCPTQRHAEMRSFIEFSGACAENEETNKKRIKLVQKMNELTHFRFYNMQNQSHCAHHRLEKCSLSLFLKKVACETLFLVKGKVLIQPFYSNKGDKVQVLKCECAKNTHTCYYNN